MAFLMSVTEILTDERAMALWKITIINLLRSMIQLVTITVNAALISGSYVCMRRPDGNTYRCSARE
jgi:hypothetical protein